jgi:hypothetical protein
MKEKLSLLACVLFLLSFSARAESIKAADGEPTPEETLLLEFMNRFRADPKAEAERILTEVGKTKMWMSRGVDLDMFKKEMEAIKPAPPLVFNLKAMDAARKHDFYMTKNGLTHVEDAGKEGFVAADFGGRMKAAGYAGSPSGENCFATAPGPLGAHIGFVIDTGAGPGGMQPGRGHRTNMASPGSREVGPGAIPNGKSLCVTYDFGNSHAARLAGGVIFNDKNNNQFYDLDEGIGGVKITSSDGSATTSWKSGSFTLELKTAGKVTLTAEFSGRTFSKTFDAGKDNIKFDWSVPAEAEIEAADKLLTKVNAIADKSSSTYFCALVELYMSVGHANVDAERRTKIDELTKDVGPQLAAHQKAVREAIASPDAKTFQQILDEHQKPYSSSTAMTWFKEASVIGTSKLALVNFEKAIEADKKYPSAGKRAFIAQLESSAKQLTIPEFSSEMQAVISKAESVADVHAPPQKQH